MILNFKTFVLCVYFLPEVFMNSILLGNYNTVTLGHCILCTLYIYRQDLSGYITVGNYHRSYPIFWDVFLPSVMFNRLAMFENRLDESARC